MTSYAIEILQSDSLFSYFLEVIYYNSAKFQLWDYKLRGAIIDGIIDVP